MPDLYRPCPAQGCDHEEAIPSEADPEGTDDPSYADLWDHVATAHADGSARITGDFMATVRVLDRANPGDTGPDRCPICGPMSNCRCPNTVGDMDVSIMRDGQWVPLPGVKKVELSPLRFNDEQRAACRKAVADVNAAFQAITVVMRPVAKAATEAMAQLVAPLRRAGVVDKNGKAVRRPDRPAWQSPHGPAKKGHRR